MDTPTTVERKSERELLVTRTLNSPAPLVFAAWATPAQFKQWWVPKSCGLTMTACELDVRTGGRYRLVYVVDGQSTPPAEFFGRYLEVTPPTRLSWTNEEAGDQGAVTTVTLEAVGEQTRLTLRDLYPSKEALDEAIASGSTSGLGETFDQLEALLTAPGPRAR